MVGGFNTNIRYQGRIFHVQTEDSGEANPYIITLLYEGGAILFSKKRSYESELASEDLESSVRALMEEQHRAMVQALKSGALEEVIDPSEPTAIAPSREPAFGDGVVTGKPLHELILAYLDRD